MHKTSTKQKILLIMFGLFLCFSLLEIGLRTGGLILSSLQKHRNKISAAKNQDYRILCLGESTTAMGSNNSYPYQLERFLNEKNLGTRFTVINEGIIAGNTTMIIASLEDNLNKYNPDLVITMMGINDTGEIIDHNILDLFKSFRAYKLFALIFLHISENLQKPSAELPKISENISELSGRDNYQQKLNNASNIITMQVKQEEAENLKDNEKRTKNLDRNEAYLTLSHHYRKTGDLLKAEEILSQAISENKNNGLAYSELAKCFWDKKEYDKAEQTLKLAIKYSINDANSYGLLALVHMAKNQSNSARIYFKKTQKLRSKNYFATTKLNYNKLKDSVTDKNIKLICMQYPMRDVNNLRRLFYNQNGAIFVDNEELFKDAVAKDGYDEYFVDIFGGDFGHCTAKGNKLIAENLGEIIINNLL